MLRKRAKLFRPTLDAKDNVFALADAPPRCFGAENSGAAGGCLSQYFWQVQ